MEVKKIKDSIWEVKKEGKMNVPVEIYASEPLLNKMKEDNCIQQGINVACMPGIVKKSIMMPDAHQGYGFSIGGVAAFDEKEGCITPGGIGFDINCGVRLVVTELTLDIVKPRMGELIDELFKKVPAGVGGSSQLKLTDEQLNEVLSKGVEWAVGNGYGTKEDLVFCEENGCMTAANPSKVSPRAKARGRKQLGTLGAGNHFLEVQLVSEIMDEKAADAFGLKKDQICVMIHCGSRGLGHQVCSDYLRRMEDEYPEIMKSLPEKDLIYAPASSEIATDYYSAMCAAANFAWTNRHIIMCQVRKAFDTVFTESKLKLVYDVAHNIAKLETHTVDGKQRKLWVHRKGATRAFGPGMPDLPKEYSKIGQPVLIPGSMGTESYVLAGTATAMDESFGSSAHGAGRLMSRFKSKQEFPAEKVKKELEAKDIMIKAASLKGISEEAPGVYKDVSEVVKVTEDAGIAKIVAKLKPLGVVKG